MSAATVTANGATGPAATPARTALATLVGARAAQLEAPGWVVATGFSPLDEVLGGGVRSGDMLLLGGKPGQGKTIAALQWARQAALSGTTAMYVCYEHDEMTLLSRLLACELGEAAGAAGCDDEFRLQDLRSQLRAVATGDRPLHDVLDGDSLLRTAEDRLCSYAERLVLVRASGSNTDLVELGRLVESHGGERTAIFVDYLQKMPVRPEPAEEAERVKRVAEGLKELALTKRVAVVSIAAADQSGLTSRRLRLHHFRGSTALAYEADAVVVLNDKLTVVSKVHLAYDTTRSGEFKRQVVFSVEKNRTGAGDANLEFVKDFANYRFNPGGTWVTERLWEEGTVEE